MVCISSQKDLRRVQTLPFCYICGRYFLDGENTDRDHVPPKSVFLAKDREPLLLRSHRACNEGWSAIDERVGQLIGLHTGRFPSDPRKRRLKLIRMGFPGWGGITGVDLERAVWRWIAGFHAALYDQPLVDFWPYIVLPFTRLDLSEGRYVLAPTNDGQHRLCVEILKLNRVRGTLDVVLANKGKLRFECVWGQSDEKKQWICFFGLNIYNWARLGKTPHTREQGCAGLYIPGSGKVPEIAARVVNSAIIIPNLFPFDPFAQ